MYNKILNYKSEIFLNLKIYNNTIIDNAIKYFFDEADFKTSYYENMRKLEIISNKENILTTKTFVNYLIILMNEK